MSHDWPRGVTQYGNVNALLKKKPFFRNDIEENKLGSPASMDLLMQHYPNYWFAAHLHCKFAALIPEKEGTRNTKFLALDKCLPRRKFLQFLEVEHDDSVPLTLTYDLEWLTILFMSNHLLSVRNGMHMMPGPGGNSRWNYTPTVEEKQKILEKMNNDLKVPLNFVKTVEPYDPESSSRKVEPPTLRKNPQTTEFCNKLEIDDPVALLQVLSGVKEVKKTSEMKEDLSFKNNDLDSSYATELGNLYVLSFESFSIFCVCLNF